MPDLDPLFARARDDLAAAAAGPGAAAVRARARTRSRRDRTALAGALLLVAGLAGVGLSGLGTDGGQDGLQFAPQPTGTAPPSTSPTGPSPSGGGPTTPPTAGPTGGPGPTTATGDAGATPGGPAAVRWQVEAAFLDAAAAGRAETPGWVVSTATPTPGPVFSPCRTGFGAPLPDRVAASGERVLGSVREAGGSELRQELYRYETPSDAAAALAAYADEARSCPNVGVGSDSAASNELVQETATRLLLRQRSCVPACTDLYTGYLFVAVAGDGLTAASYRVGEDGDPADGAAALLEASADRLAATVR